METEAAETKDASETASAEPPPDDGSASVPSQNVEPDSQEVETPKDEPMDTDPSVDVAVKKLDSDEGESAAEKSPSLPSIAMAGTAPIGTPTRTQHHYSESRQSHHNMEKPIVPINLPLHPSQINEDVQTALAHGLQIPLPSQLGFASGPPIFLNTSPSPKRGRPKGEAVAITSKKSVSVL